MVNQRDLALAYSPGRGRGLRGDRQADPANAFRYTSRGNLVAVVTNGTAVLGLGDIGPLAAKPVMEGKGVLFKKFAGIDVFDIEIDEKNLDKLVDIIAALEPTFGGINLEDIKAPDCFYVERKLRERMKIPVFHDDQHGTAIVVGAALLNALKVVGKDIDQVKLVTSGAGAAALACLGLLVKLGVPRENIWVTDLAGVVYEGRTELMDEDKAQFRAEDGAAHAGRGDRRRRRLPGPVGRRRAQARHGGAMAAAAADLRAGQPDAGDPARGGQGGARRRHHGHRPHRLPEPGQQRPVLPLHLPRRAGLRRDHGHDAMEIAAVHAIAELAQAEQSEVVAAAYAGATLSFGPEYLIPKPFDPRLMMKIAPAVARRGRQGVALRPIADMAPTARSCRASSTPRARR
jgi:malate dehydrogenase (oxaloacetate-decarboxylating)(NADP+)